MAQTLPSSAAAERLRWLTPFLEGHRTLREMAELSPFTYRTLKRWRRAYRRDGIGGLEPKSRRPHTSPRRTPEELVNEIRRIRTEAPIPCFGAKKIAVNLHGALHWRAVHKVLKREGLVRTQRRIVTKDRWKPKATTPGELIEIDVAYVKKYKGRWLYQFTAIDSCTRWRYCWVTPEQSNRTALRFLEKLLAAAPFPIRGIKTDNASIFTNYYTGYRKSADPLKPRLHAFDRACQELRIVHYLIDPGKPAQNGKVERSHRTDREEFWRRITFRTLAEARKKQMMYVAWYNRERPHLGIDGLTPEEKLASVQGTNV